MSNVSKQGKIQNIKRILWPKYTHTPHTAIEVFLLGTIFIYSTQPTNTLESPVKRYGFTVLTILLYVSNTILYYCRVDRLYRVNYIKRFMVFVTT